MNNKRNHNGKFIKSAEMVDCICLFCRSSFRTKKSGLKYGRGKYCKRACFDLHKKELQRGENNGMYGKKETPEHKKIRGEKIKVGTTSETIKKRKRGVLEFVKKNGYYPGTDVHSKEKRRQTFLKNYGVDHPWKIKRIREKCDETCIKLYGKTCWNLFVDSALYGHDTKIEKKVHGFLDDLKINYIPHFSLPYKTSYREYDIAIPQLKILIELDGDFWHANPSVFKDKLYEVQVRNKENDVVKNKLAEKNGWIILRFWESAIHKNEFKDIFLQTLKNYGYNKD